MDRGPRHKAELRVVLDWPILSLLLLPRAHILGDQLVAAVVDEFNAGRLPLSGDQITAYWGYDNGFKDENDRKLELS